MAHEHAFDRRHLSFAHGQPVRCLECETLVTPREPVALQDYEYDRVTFCRQLAEMVGIYLCPVCVEFDTDSKRHAKQSPACVGEAQVAHA